MDPERDPSSTTVASISSPSRRWTSPVAGVAELADVDRGLGLAADRHEGRRRADGDHAAADDVAGGDATLSGLRALARLEQGGEVLVVASGHRPDSTPDARRSPGVGGRP
jgi:hypothetical protein